MIVAPILFVVSVVLILLVWYIDPGYTKSIPIKNYYEYLSRSIKEQRNLDYYCFFCRSLWSSTAVHCMTCGKCVEGFDHHCVVANNCIGYRNHGLFLTWLTIFLIYSLITMFNLVVAIDIYVHRIRYCVFWRRQGAHVEKCDPMPYTMDYTWAGLAALFFIFELILCLPLGWQIL